MSKKVYEVEITTTAYVVAESEKEAEDEIRSAGQLNDELGTWDVWPTEYTRPIPGLAWNSNCIPFGGGEDERTLREWLTVKEPQ